jgi:hypothetical protein
MNVIHDRASHESSGPVAIPRHCWTADRWGRLLAGSTSGLCLAAGWLWPGCQTWAWSLIGIIALQLVVTSLIGWCPLQELVRRLGIPEREEVYVRLQRNNSPARTASTGF